MKLFKVKNKFANYGLNTYLVIAESSVVAIRRASAKLRKYALETKYTYNKEAYEQAGMNPVDIFDHIHRPTYLGYFSAECLSEDIETDNVITVSGMY